MTVLAKDHRFSALGMIVAAIALAAAVLAFAAPASAMTFEQITGPTDCAQRACILASGMIDAQTPGDFNRFVKDHHVASGALVVLNSEGGVLLYGLSLGDLIRKDGLSTTVQAFDHAAGRFEAGGECASACAFTFLGGVQRSVGQGARVGVHQIYSDPQARDALSVADAQYLTSLVAMHIQRMGAAMDMLILTLRTPPQNIHWLSSAELIHMAVTTASADA
jgi:hypothetical protein